MEEDIKLLLSYIETAIKEGKKPIIGGGVIVDGAAILKLLERVRAALDVATGEDVIQQATQKANEIITFAEQSKEKLIDQDIATREAKARAERIVRQAMLEKAKIEKELMQNLTFMLNNAKQAVVQADESITKALGDANKSLDSALSRVGKKFDDE